MEILDFGEMVHFGLTITLGDEILHEVRVAVDPVLLKDAREDAISAVFNVLHRQATIYAPGEVSAA